MIALKNNFSCKLLQKPKENEWQSDGRMTDQILGVLRVNKKIMA